jgi:hypothetical protein
MGLTSEFFALARTKAARGRVSDDSVAFQNLLAGARGLHSLDR